MRDQYASDISDYLKFSFLLAVSGDTRRLGVAWYYLPGHDGRPDGRHVEYKQEHQWRDLNPSVFDQMLIVSEQSVAALETLSFWPDATLFHRDPVDTQRRKNWVDSMVTSMNGADHVFVDPDNGLGTSAIKHAWITDLIALKTESRAISIIKFPGRHKSHADQIRDLHQELVADGFANPITVNTCVSVPNGTRAYVPRHRFFTVANTDAAIRKRAQNFVRQLNGLDRVTRASATIVE
jgi:hypothetical protein